MLELANTFHRSLARLTNAEQTATKSVIFDYMSDPSRPGLSLHRVDKAREKDFWTIRVNRDLRIVVYKQREKSVFCYVAHHDGSKAPLRASPARSSNDAFSLPQKSTR